MPISIYPPTLKSTQPAFIYDTNNYPINFSLQKVTSAQEINHIQIRVVRQSNNKSIVNTSKYPDGIIYKNIKLPEDKNTYSVSIVTSTDLAESDLMESWQPGYLYKIQLRFGKDSIFTSISGFTEWKQQQIKNEAFSEWSTVMIIKAISQPNVYIKNREIPKTDDVWTYRPEMSRMPLFTGAYEIDSVSKEAEDTYRFKLYSGESIDDDQLLEDSGWLQHNNVVNTVDTHRFKTVLNADFDNKYTVTYTIKTINEYEKSADPYTFLVSENFLSALTGIELEVDDSSSYCTENGCMNIYLTTEEEINGSFVISRSSEKTNFQVYEDLKYILCDRKQFSKTLVFQDFTIESGIKYKYIIQQQKSENGLRTTPLYEKDENYRVVNFEYAYLYHDDVQIKLMFNNKVSSFKHTVLTSKQDTLGDKYPHLSKNGYAYYAEFTITGLISLWMDEDQTFFKRGPNGYYYQDELIIPSDKYLENDTDEIFNFDLTSDNIFIERKFREKVEEFLNNFDYKLFKSPTEGNMVIVLDNVTLTPNETLGRMIYEFSANAHEVLENTIKNLNEYKIIDVGHFEFLADVSEDFPSFGQISGLFVGDYSYYKNILEKEELMNSLVDEWHRKEWQIREDNTLTEQEQDIKRAELNAYYDERLRQLEDEMEAIEKYPPIELLDKIKENEEKSTSDGYKTKVKKITALSVEQYPHVDFEEELIELEAKRMIAIGENKDVSAIDEKIQEYKNLQNYLRETPESKIAVLIINNKEIIIGMGKTYYLNDIDEEIEFIKLKYTGAVIINYVCDLVQIKDEETKVVSEIKALRVWGQVSGIFTPTDSILKKYNLEYEKSKTDRVYNMYKDDSIMYGPYGDIILDNTSINLYKSINIEDIIKQEVKRQVEISNGLKDGFTDYDESTDQWNNGSIYYEFGSIYSLDIEADPGTILYVGKAADGSDKTEVTIGPTGRYTLNPIINSINYVSFKFPQFGIVNYKCLASQVTMSKGE